MGDLKDFESRVLGLGVDVTNPDQVSTITEEGLTKFGQILVINVGFD